MINNITGATAEQQAKANELEARLNKGVDHNYEDYTIWQCWDGKTKVNYSNVTCNKDYELDTDDVDEVVAIFSSDHKKDYCVYETEYDYD